ncbi:hypothetical protein [Xanthomonas hortorum]|nr:hypothetical protein [Xanthomonas hortorum]WOB33258.1 hypothetical protein NYR96_12115 [Xanthomonas hortorum pv. pelargonii]WOB33269.1 hypothetical protein NYR96_12180 [Xanthomonas hortorum pv. pelargonii]
MISQYEANLIALFFLFCIVVGVVFGLMDNYRYGRRKRDASRNEGV